MNWFCSSRGKGDNHRLGHGNEDHVRQPRQVEALSGKKVVDLAVGSMHVLALTDEGEVYAWGGNDQGQLGDSAMNSKAEPTLMTSLEGKNIIGVACGPSQVSWDDCWNVKKIFFPVMAWCRLATSHYLSQCWPWSMSPCDITSPQWVNP